MIVADRKPLAEIRDMVKDFTKVLILGCKGCVTVCNVGGAKEVEIFSFSLKISKDRLSRGEFVKVTAQDKSENLLEGAKSFGSLFNGGAK